MTEAAVIEGAMAEGMYLDIARIELPPSVKDRCTRNHAPLGAFFFSFDFVLPVSTKKALHHTV
ncbi:hypothetical protein GCM10010520_23160 [Rhizobium viscosum]